MQQSSAAPGEYSASDQRTMNRDDVFRSLVELETLLHRLDVRRDPERLAELLHPEFEEIGRSGRRYSREEILKEFVDGRTLPEIHSEGFNLALFGNDVALLTYKSAHVGEHGKLDRWTFRASLWLRMEQGWGMRFHQGTPTDVGYGHAADE